MSETDDSNLVDNLNEEYSATENCNFKHSSNVSKDELDEVTLEKLKGDTIGSTLYSESFVLKTLLQLSELDWNDQVEEDLCFLWDMTVEEDVCKYLFQVYFPAIACTAIEKYNNENRFVEIIIGILANILCVSRGITLSTEEVKTVLSWLNTDDSLILVQVMRFVSAVTSSDPEKCSLVDIEVFKKFSFILSNSIKQDLILKTLEALSKLTSDFKVDKTLISSELFISVLTGYQTALKKNFDLDLEDNRSATKFMLENVVNICAYVDKFNDKKLLCDISEKTFTFVNIISKVLCYYNSKENLFPISDEFTFYMEAILFILTTIDISFLMNLFTVLHKVLYELFEYKDECNVIFRTTMELECFLMSKTTGETLYNVFKPYCFQKMIKILKCFRESTHEFDFNISEQLDYLQNAMNTHGK